ncbi:ACT domain-containing protein [Mesorhizobium sediminum]|nr:ACT domain-containing protein [Mesorhizobium sediminum]
MGKKRNAPSRSIKLRVVPGIYGLARLAGDAPIPDWANGAGFSAIVRADDELTIVCPQDRIPNQVDADRNWRCFRSLGPFAFDATGIVLSLIQPLSTQGVGVFVVCTFDGEHILVPERNWDKSRAFLEGAGHVFVE